MVRLNGAEHSAERKIKGRRAAAKGFYGRLPHQKEKEKRGRGSAVLHQGKSRGDNPPAGFRQGAAGKKPPRGAAKRNKARTLQRTEHFLDKDKMRRVRLLVRTENMARGHAVSEDGIPVQS